MHEPTSAEIVRKLDSLIETVEAHISEQSALMFAGDAGEQDQATLADMLDTLERLHAFRERFYATVH